MLKGWSKRIPMTVRDVIFKKKQNKQYAVAVPPNQRDAHLRDIWQMFDIFNIVLTWDVLTGICWVSQGCC